MQMLKIDRKQVEGFAKVWTYKGVALCLNDAHIQFAADFAQQVLISFIENVKKQQMAAMEAAKAKQIIPSAL
jgi:hypothetical protein